MGPPYGSRCSGVVTVDRVLPVPRVQPGIRVGDGLEVLASLLVAERVALDRDGRVAALRDRGERVERAEQAIKRRGDGRWVPFALAVHRRVDGSALVAEVREQRVADGSVGTDDDPRVVPAVAGVALLRGVEGARVRELDAADVVRNHARAVSREPLCELVPRHQARDMYEPERVSTLILSPMLTNSGTFTVAPVSSVAGLLPPPEAVSPLTPGSVCVTSSSTDAPSWMSAGLPSM